MFRKLLLISILNLILFSCVYFSLQHNSVYSHTLGRISDNYERFGDWRNPDIRPVKKPFVTISDNNFENWDAAIYKCIKKTMYADTGCDYEVKGTFFPLFPLVWKVTTLNNIGISFCNYFIFAISIALLITHFLKTDDRNKLLIYFLCIALPSVVVYFIPYTEALFLLCAAFTFIGIAKNKYYLYFISAVLLAMVRPATVFILLAFLAVEGISLVANKSIKTFLKNIALRSVPFALGYFLAIFIQFLYTSSWTTFLDAGVYWNGETFNAIETISDWSKEGFGLSSFAIFFVCVPAFAYLLYSVINQEARKNAYSQDMEGYHHYYVFMASLFYLVGLLLFTLLTSSGNFHSFSRFVLDSPSFYIAIIFFLNYLPSLNKNTILLLCIAPIVLLVIFFLSIDYGGNKLTFNYTGLYLYILIFLFLLFRNKFSLNAQIAFIAILILCSTVWNTYLLNMFFNEAWVFT